MFQTLRVLDFEFQKDKKKNDGKKTKFEKKYMSLQPIKQVRNVRLPRNVLPRHYDIRLLPIIEKGNFSIYGDISINLECKAETDRIILHSADITVDAASVKVRYSYYHNEIKLSNLEESL